MRKMVLPSLPPSSLNMSSWDLRDLGTLPYQAAWELQDDLRRARVAREIPDTFLLVEHPPVFTLGKRDASADFLTSPEVIAKHGIEIIKTNRGGKITYHGPGQIVGYFIFDLQSVHLSVKDFVCKVEEVCKRTLADFGVIGERDAEHPGVWIGKNKIAAVGLNFSQNVSQHGFALNVQPNLMHYVHIVPCGIQDRGITSLQQILGEKCPNLQEVKQSIARHVGEIFFSSAEFSAPAGCTANRLSAPEAKPVQ